MLTREVFIFRGQARVNELKWQQHQRVTYKIVLFKMYEAKDTHCSYLLENKIAHLLGMVLEGKYSSCSGRQEVIFPLLEGHLSP